MKWEQELGDSSRDVQPRGIVASNSTRTENGGEQCEKHWQRLYLQAVTVSRRRYEVPHGAESLIANNLTQREALEMHRSLRPAKRDLFFRLTSYIGSASIGSQNVKNPAIGGAGFSPGVREPHTIMSGGPLITVLGMGTRGRGTGAGFSKTKSFSLRPYIL